ncbi:hypothetical protein BGZ63DRAFT_201376 [Mariannaea sp. PMI_226]|nr:hypothetical protein BGZ63DRAFT_201376 [Mariannaea sp. PMI_226]
MVGVPKSKGCTLCLKRGVKCDEARPSCSQCRRGGRVCPGYIRGMKFVDEGPKLQRSHRAPSCSKSRPSQGTTIRTSIPATKGSDLLGSGTAAIHSTKDLSRQDIRLYRLSSWKPERDQLLSSFVSAMFPLGVASAQASFLGSWLWHVPPRLGKYAVLDLAALSLASAYFARTSGDERILQRAEVAYTLALRSLSKAISDTSMRFSSEVLCAALLLGHYEVCLTPSPSVYEDVLT